MPFALFFTSRSEGTLAGYNYSIGSAGDASAAALQATIWWLEGEGANPNNAFSTLVTALPNYLHDNNGYYGVSVLNLWSDSNHTQVAQDQLIRNSVPDVGSTAMLLGVALGALGMARRFLKS